MSSKRHLSALALIFGLPLVAGAAPMCPLGTTPVSVTGRVTTINISPTKQAGQICVTLTTADGQEMFEDCGALMGKMTATDASTGSSTLNHVAIFDLLQSFHTVGDTAQVISVTRADADGAPCAMTVREHMTNLQGGTGIFQDASIDVFADGSISFCPDKNLNTFQLSGQGCVRNRRHHRW
jgi:hypothetical protein